MQNVRLTVFARSDVGRVRSNNEDAFLISDLDSGARLDAPAIDVDVRERGILVVVSDGMGGHAAGDVASALVVESLRRSLSDRAADHSSLQRLIDSAVQRANADVQDAARAREKRGMGATLTAVLVHDNDAYVAEVGDSRGYLLRAGRLRQITKDQSFVQMLVDGGVLTPEEAKGAPQKNVILQAIGREKNVQVSIGRLRLRRGDRLLLCCDGLSNVVTDLELEGLLGDEELATACDRMIDLANERGGQDNITAVVALVEGEGLPLPTRGEPLQTIEVLQEYQGPMSSPVASAPSASASAPAASPSSKSVSPSARSVSPLPEGAPGGPARVGLIVALIVGVGLAAALAWRYLM